MASPVLRLSTSADVKALYPEKIKHNIYAITADLDGQPVAIAGLYFDRNWILFTKIQPELRPYKLTIWRAAVELMKAIKALDKPVYAMADPSIPRSDHLLLKMGFKHLSKDWYICQPEE